MSAMEFRQVSKAELDDWEAGLPYKLAWLANTLGDSIDAFVDGDDTPWPDGVVARVQLPRGDDESVAYHIRDGARGGWQPIGTAPDGVDVLVLDVRTGQRGISGSNDTDERRGFKHRNGFPATHWAPLLTALPTDPRFGAPSE